MVVSNSPSLFEDMKNYSSEKCAAALDPLMHWTVFDDD